MEEKQLPRRGNYKHLLRRTDNNSSPDDFYLYRKPNNNPPPSNTNPPAPTLIDYIKILFAKKWLILGCTLAILIPSIIWIWSVTPIYETESSIIYEEANDTAFLLDLGQSFYNKSAILNMVEQIKSRALAEEVAKNLPPDVVATFQLPDARPANFSRDKFIAGTIKKNLEVLNVRGADIIKIKIQANNPLAAKIIADAYADHIVDWFLKKNKAEISNIRSFVEGQINVFQEKLRTAEEELLEFKEHNDLIKLSDASSEMISSLTDVEVAYNQAKTEREALEQRRRFIEQKKQELMPSLGVSDNESAQKIKAELLDMERQYSAAQMQAESRNQESLATLRDKINESKKDLINELMKNGVRENLADPISQIRNLLQESINLEVDLETYKAREQGLKGTMKQYTQQLERLPKRELELARLIRAKEVNDKIFSILLEKREEARITEAGKVGDVRIIDYAETPLFPIKPQKMKMVVLALLLGLSFGASLTFILHSLDKSLKTDQDIEKYLNLPVIAAVPRIPGNGVHHKITQKETVMDSYQSRLLTKTWTKSHIFEAYRALQLNFLFLNPDNKLKSILITSSEPGAGKTLTSVNIAQFYAREGTKTILLDCDLRRPMVHKALNLNLEPGLSNFICDKAINIAPYLHLLEDDFLHHNLSVLTCGTLPPNPSELLGSKKMEDVIADLYETNDLLIIDSPPIISVMDSIILGQIVDGVVLVLRSGKTNFEAAIRAKKILETGKVNILGTLLNDIDLKSTYGYYKDYYYYSDKKTV
jgi:tyrosine-protein kinase Etk/Wzc